MYWYWQFAVTIICSRKNFGFTATEGRRLSSHASTDEIKLMFTGFQNNCTQLVNKLFVGEWCVVSEEFDVHFWFSICPHSTSSIITRIIMSRSNARRSITPSPSINFDHLAAVPVPVLGGSMSFICVEPREEEQEIIQSKDKGWAWVVCAGSFLMMFFTFGTHTCFGVFLSALLDHFKDSKADTGILYYCT